jgi:hypothetical protein
MPRRLDSDMKLACRPFRSACSSGCRQLMHSSAGRADPGGLLNRLSAAYKRIWLFSRELRRMDFLDGGSSCKLRLDLDSASANVLTSLMPHPLGKDNLAFAHAAQTLVSLTQNYWNATSLVA